jgi:hypothetical protein
VVCGRSFIGKRPLPPPLGWTAGPEVNEQTSLGEGAALSLGAELVPHLWLDAGGDRYLRIPEGDS